VKTGTWWGDDYPGDPSGYGRLCGTDDGSIYDSERDCELWFDIHQNDFDHDGIPYWSEVYVYGTNPEVDDRGLDTDGDGIPYEWEHRWGLQIDSWSGEYYWIYHPFYGEDHQHLDPEHDGLTNIQEYLTSPWGSDPFRKDLFIELDQMEESPAGDISLLPEESKELLRTAFESHNVVYHLDDGGMGGGEMIPFQEMVDYEELQQIYWNYFLHGNESNWRRGVFHYGLVVYNASYPGFVFWAVSVPIWMHIRYRVKAWRRKQGFPY